MSVFIEFTHQGSELKGTVALEQIISIEELPDGTACLHANGWRQCTNELYLDLLATIGQLKGNRIRISKHKPVMERVT